MPISPTRASSLFRRKAKDTEKSDATDGTVKPAPSDAGLSAIHDPEASQSELEIFEGNDDEDDDGGGDDEEDAKILNMSLIRNVLNHSSSDLRPARQQSTSDSPPDTPVASPPGKEELMAFERNIEASKTVSFSGIESIESKDDDEKDHEELVGKIGKIQAKLTQAEIDKSAEKAMRKKKDKSLVKLAKELNKRAADQLEKEKTINMVSFTTSYCSNL